MDSALTHITLDSVDRGTLPERFRLAMEEVIRNVADPSMPAKEKRSITIKVVVAPEKNREGAAIHAELSMKLAGQKTDAQTVYFGQDSEGRPVAATFDPRQAHLWPEKETDIHPLRTETRNGTDGE